MTDFKIHIAGYAVQVGGRYMQRCSWCGEVLYHFELENTLTIGGGNVPSWKPGDLVEVHEGWSCRLNHVPGTPMPKGWCGEEPTKPTLRLVRPDETPEKEEASCPK